MSLEALSALKQLVQVRDQGANVQNDNLETAQKQVQQVGTGEAKRVDELNLEKVKAEYEVELTKARVDRLQSQLGAENKAVNNAQFITTGVAVLSIGDKAMNFYADMNGAQKFKDQTDGNLQKDGNGNVARFDKSGNQLMLSKDGEAEKDGSGNIKVSDSKGNDITGTKAFNESDFQGRGDGNTLLGRDMAGGAQITKARAGSTTGSDTYNASTETERGTAVTRTGVNGSGGVDGVRVGFISKEKMDKALTDAGLDPAKIAAAGGNPFAALMQKDPAKAEALFEKGSGHRDLQRNEANIALGSIGAGAKTNIGIDQNGKPVQDLGKMQAGLVKNGDFSSGMKDRVQGFLDQKKVTGGDVGAMDTLKYGANAVIGVVEDVSPFFQAYLKMKSQRDTTADELQAEIAKLAAGRKRLKALEDAIMSPGAGAEGSAAGAGQAAAA